MDNKVHVQVLGEFFFSQLRGIPIYDRERQRVGELRDLAIRWEGGTPKITAIKYAKGVQEHIPVEQVEDVQLMGVKLKGSLEAEQLVLLQPDEIYMGKWLMDKQIIDTKGAKVVRVNDIKLFWLQSGQRKYLLPAAVDIGLRGLARRLGVEFLFKKRENHFVWWQSIQHLEEKTASLQLVSEKSQLDKLHPADLADILEDLDYKKRTDFIEDLDVETVAEAVAEMEADTQMEILEHLDSHQAAELLQEMPPDEAADLLGELTEEKSDELLKLMEPEEAQEVRELMEHEEGTAGALMTTEYIALPPELTVAEAFSRLRKLAAEAETIYYLYILGEDETLLGIVTLRDLLVAEPETRLQDLMQTRIISVLPEDSNEQVTELIDKYALLALPVVEEGGKLAGIITVDDVLEMLIPDRSSLETFANFFVSKRSAKGSKES
ncbi:MAG: CBS domain-containing protein [Desulfobaccales bacterium]|jgi:CBS domain-containing protein/sporulation protein YlmC with PRC-barrel domain